MSESTTEFQSNTGNAIDRVGQWPVVTGMVGQLTTMYSRTKDSNRLMHKALDSAESGLKFVAHSAAPVATVFDKPFAKLNTIACNQLDKLEQRYPIVTKPTEEVVRETKQAYNDKVKPTVDRVLSVTKYGTDGYHTVKDFGCNKVNDVKHYTYVTVNGVKDFGLHKFHNAKEYTYCTVDTVARYGFGKMADLKSGTLVTIDGMRRYSAGKVLAVQDYGHQAAQAALNANLTKMAATQLINALDVAEYYVDKHLPAEKGENFIRSERKQPAVQKLGTIAGKVRQRMHARAMRQLSNLQLRSQETLQKLHFTVDLIEYAKTNMATTEAGLLNARHRLADIWTEIKRDDPEMENNLDESKTDVVADEHVTFTPLEQSAIQAARTLTIKLRQGIDSVGPIVKNVMPPSVQERLADAKTYANNLYTQFHSNTGSALHVAGFYYESITNAVLQSRANLTLSQVRENMAMLRGSLERLMENVLSSESLSWAVPVKLRMMSMHHYNSNNASNTEMMSFDRMQEPIANDFEDDYDIDNSSVENRDNDSKIGYADEKTTETTIGDDTAEHGEHDDSQEHGESDDDEEKKHGTED